MRRRCSAPLEGTVAPDGQLADHIVNVSPHANRSPCDACNRFTDGLSQLSGQYFGTDFSLRSSVNLVGEARFRLDNSAVIGLAYTYYATCAAERSFKTPRIYTVHPFCSLV